MPPPQSVLLVTHPHLGDAVNATFAGSAMRRAWPQARIEAATGPAGLELLSATGSFDRVALRPEGAARRLAWAARLRARPPDVAVFAYSNRGLVRAARAGGARQVWVVQGDRPCPAPDREVLLGPEEPEVPWGLARLLEEGGVAVGQPAPFVAPREPDKERAAALHRQVEAQAGPAVALHAGSSDPAKRWPDPHWHALAQAVVAAGLAPVWVGGEGAADGPRALGAPGLDLCGTLGVLGSAAFLAGCRALVTGDSGPMHLAAAVGCRVVAIFGPTSARRHRPWGEGHCLVQAKEGQGLESVMPAEVAEELRRVVGT